MTTEVIGSIVSWLIIAVIVIVVLAYLLNWFYHRSSKQVAFVRTGFGGEKVVINGGALVLPIIHEVTPVNLNVVRIQVDRNREEAIITRDRMRVDVTAEFFVRVIQEKAAVATAASILGRKTMEADQLSELLSGKFIDALRSVAAEMSLDEMHENRGNLVARVQERAAETLANNGLELEFVAVTDLDQTNLEFFNPANRFDAEGMTQLIETIETRRKLRNDIEQASMVAIRTRNLEAEKETLKLEQESENSRLNQEKELAAIRAEQQAAIASNEAARRAEAEQANIASEQETREREISRRKSVEESEIKAQEALEKARIAQDQALEQARINREQKIREQNIRQRHELENAEIIANEDIERAKIASERLLRESKIMADEELEAREIARGQQIDLAKITAHKAIESARVEQDKVLDKARIEREQKLREQELAQQKSLNEIEISAKEEVERARITSEHEVNEARILKERDLKLLEIDQQISLLQKQSEEAQSSIATDEARANAVEAAEKVVTTRETEVAKRIAEIDRMIAEKDAETAKIAAQAEEVEATVGAAAQRLYNEAENVLSDDARAARTRSKLIDRMESIVRESVKPMEKIDGINILHVDGLSGGDSKQTPTDEVMNSALRYRVQAPLIDGMMKEIGVENSNLTQMGDIFRSARDAQSIAKENNDKGSKKKKD